MRDQFTEYESKTKSEVSNSDYINENQRKRSTRISFFDGPAVDTVMDSRTTFKVSSFLPIIDSIKTERERPGKAHTEIHEYFGFLVDQDRENLSCKLISVKCHALNCFSVQEWPSSRQVGLRVYTFLAVLPKCCCWQWKQDIYGAAEHYSLTKADGVESVFSNIEVALSIYLSLFVSNYTLAREIILTLAASEIFKPVNHVARLAEQAELLRSNEHWKRHITINWLCWCYLRLCIT